MNNSSQKSIVGWVAHLALLLITTMTSYGQTPYVLREILKFQDDQVVDQKAVENFIGTFFDPTSKETTAYTDTIKDFLSLTSPRKFKALSAVSNGLLYAWNDPSAIETSQSSGIYDDSNTAREPPPTNQDRSGGAQDQSLSFDINRISAQVLASFAKDATERAVATSIEYALRKSTFATNKAPYLRKLFPQLKFQIEEIANGRIGALGFLKAASNAASADLFGFPRALIQLADETQQRDKERDAFEKMLCSPEFDSVYLGLSFLVAFQSGLQTPIAISEVYERFAKRVVAANPTGSNVSEIRYQVEMLSGISRSLQKNKSEYLDIDTIRSSLKNRDVRSVYINLLSRRIAKELNLYKAVDRDALGERVDSFVSSIEMLREAVRDFRSTSEIATGTQELIKEATQTDGSRMVSAIRQLLDVSAGEADFKSDSGIQPERVKWRAAVDFVRVLGYLNAGSYGQAAMMLTAKARELTSDSFKESSDVVTLINIAVSLKEVKSLDDLAVILDPSSSNATYVTNLVRNYTVSLESGVGAQLGGQTLFGSDGKNSAYASPWLPVGINFHWKGYSSFSLYVLDLGQLLRKPILLGDSSSSYSINLSSVLTIGSSLGVRIADSPVILGLSVQYQPEFAHEASEPKASGITYGLGVAVEVPFFFIHSE